MTLQDVLDRVLQFNESVQVKLLENEVARRQLKAEKGIFEPAVVASFEHLDSKRPVTDELRANLSGGLFSPFAANLYNQRNDSYNAGLEFLSPVGTRFRLGYELRDMSNNLNRRRGGSEYLSTIGVSLTQPLLKNFGLAATMVRIRLAAVNSDIAYQEYRQQLIQIVARAEAAYWDLYLAQEQEIIASESVSVADKILKDNKARLEVGKSSELEVLEAEAGYSLRSTRRADASQRLAEATGQLNTLFSGINRNPSGTIRAVQQPVARDVRLDFGDAYQHAFDLNPVYLIRKNQAVAERVRLAYAKNQRWPQLDLKASYGLNGLDRDFGGSFDAIDDGTYPAWSVGVEMRIPVTGGIRERNELAAAKLNQKRALHSIKEAEVEIGNLLEIALLRVRNLRETVRSYESVITFHDQLLETQLTRLEVGQIDSRDVLETEEKLFQARIAALDALIQYQKALLEWEALQGVTLQARGLDLAKADLETKTRDLLNAEALSGPELRELQQEVEREYALRKDTRSFADPSQGTPQARPASMPMPSRVPPARRVVSPGSPGSTTDQQEKALQILRGNP